jgi:hypothetical protein
VSQKPSSLVIRDQLVVSREPIIMEVVDAEDGKVLGNEKWDEP